MREALYFQYQRGSRKCRPFLIAARRPSAGLVLFQDWQQVPFWGKYLTHFTRVEFFSIYYFNLISERFFCLLDSE